MSDKSMNDVLVEVRKTHEALKEYIDKQVEEVRAKGHSSAETDASLEKVQTELAVLTEQYNELRKEANRPGGDMAGAGEGLTPEMELRNTAFEKMLRHGAGETGRAMMSADEIRALSSASDADGGFLVPAGFESEIITNAYNEAELRPLCQVATTGRDSVQMGALSKPAVAWGSKNLSVSPQDLNAGGERIEIHDLKALVLLHNNTLADADANIWSELTSLFQMAVGEAEDSAFAIGVGNDSPQGVAADSRVQENYTPTLVANAIKDGSNDGVEQLIKMQYSLKKAYRRNATWAMNSATEGAVRALKSSNGDYLWQPPIQAGAPSTLLGSPIANPEDMPDIAAGTFPIVYGDFRKGYKIRDRSGVTIQRLVERYAEADQTGFLLKRRTGGQVTLPEAFVSLKVATS